MADQRSVDDPDFGGRHRRYWSYRNQDSAIRVGTCCGQAAVYSAYRTRRDRTYPHGLTGLVRDHPPDNVFGTLGTSPGRVDATVRALGLVGGVRQSLPRMVADLAERPVLVCLDAGKLSPPIWGLHWVALFGFGGGDAHVSNWQNGRIPFRQFRDAWTAPLVWAAGMAEHYVRT